MSELSRAAADGSRDFSADVDPCQRAWVEVSPQAIEANAAALCRHLAEPCSLMAVVKADGYGHGAVTVARAALRGGATCLGVATLQEGIELRVAGIEAPVLLLGNLTQAEELRSCLNWALMPTLSGMREALLCQNLADGTGRRFPVQLKLDTGMARLGCDWEEGPRLVDAIRQLENLELRGLYSHLACADGDPNGHDAAITARQNQRFQDVLNHLPGRGRDLSRHLANSAGTLLDHDLHYDMVRVGLALYGHAPAQHLEGVIPLQPALTVKARVTLIRSIGAGVGASYGHRFISERPTRLAVVGIGYADGVVRSLSGKIHALHRGKALPQVGAITMDQLLLDASEAPELDTGSSVTLLGCDGDSQISPQDWSARCDSIPWEILCGFKQRLPRVEI